MIDVIKWLWEMLAYLVKSALSWKVFDEFSYLHLVLGLALLLCLLSFLTFGFTWSGGAADYGGAIIRSKRAENYKDKQNYKDNNKKNNKKKKGS